MESRTDKQLKDKAQAEEAQNWASNLNQVWVSAHWGGDGCNWEHTGEAHWFTFAQYRLCPVTHHLSIWCRVTFSTNVTKSSRYTRCNMKLEAAQHCRWNLFSNERTLMTICFSSYAFKLWLFPPWLSFTSVLDFTGVNYFDFIQSRKRKADAKFWILTRFTPEITNL